MIPLFAHERRGADAEGHTDGRLFDVDDRHCLRIFQRCDSVADGNPFRSGDAHDIPGRGLGNFHAFHPSEYEDSLQVVNGRLFVAGQ